MKENPPPIDAFFEGNHPDLTQLGARLRALRQRAHLTQSELAQRAGLHRGTIADLERGRRCNIWFSTARRLASALGLYSPQPLLSELGLHDENNTGEAVTSDYGQQHQNHRNSEHQESKR